MVVDLPGERALEERVSLLEYQRGHRIDDGHQLSFLRQSSLHGESAVSGGSLACWTA